MKKSAKTPMKQIERWILDALRASSEALNLSETVAKLEATKELSEADRTPQSGHEHESTFAYRARWAVTRLRKRGLAKRGSPRGMVELADAADALKAEEAPGKQIEPDAAEGSASRQVWIFQANPKLYRILDALQALDRVTFLVNRYKDAITVGDTVLLWMSGKYAGIYAQARVVDGVELRSSEGPDADFWTDRATVETVKPRVVLQIEKRCLAAPVLKTQLLDHPNLHDLMIIRQPNGTNFRVTEEQWSSLQDLIPTEDSRDPDPAILSWAIQRSRGGKLYQQTCGELFERYVADYFEADRTYPRDAIVAWFSERYPLFKPTTVQCHIEKYTTNFASRVHFSAGPEHDLLYREDGDWSRLRLYRPEDDPAPIHKSAAEVGQVDSGGKRSAAARKAWETRRKRVNASAGTPTERHRRLLCHLAKFGELARSERERLALVDGDLEAWLDALLIARPGAHVVSPLFLELVEADQSPVGLTTRLAARLLGHHVYRVLKEPVDSLEDYVWEHFGAWHLCQPAAGDDKRRAYLDVPAAEAADGAASERLDLFAQLTPSVIGELVRDTNFVGEQQHWSAEAATKGDLGVLSRQIKLGVKRPLFLSHFRIPEPSGAESALAEFPESEVIKRTHVVAGLALCTPAEWAEEVRLQRSALVARLLEHPLYAVIVQFEVHRLVASLSGNAAAALHHAKEPCTFEVDGVEMGALWAAARTLLTEVGFCPAAQSTADTFWASAVEVALNNLLSLGVFESAGHVLSLTEQFASEVKAHPGHVQNRGEKGFRIRLLRYLEGLQRGGER